MNLQEIERRQNRLRNDLAAIEGMNDGIARRVRKLQRSANHLALMAFVTGVLVGLFLAQFIRW